MGSFVPSNVSICGTLNFAGRGKCSTPTVNGDLVCCTRSSIKTVQVIGRASPADRLGGFNKFSPIPIEKAPLVWRRLWERLFPYK